MRVRSPLLATVLLVAVGLVVVLYLWGMPGGRQAPLTPEERRNLQAAIVGELWGPNSEEAKRLKSIGPRDYDYAFSRDGPKAFLVNATVTVWSADRIYTVDHAIAGRIHFEGVEDGVLTWWTTEWEHEVLD